MPARLFADTIFLLEHLRVVTPMANNAISDCKDRNGIFVGYPGPAEYILIESLE